MASISSLVAEVAGVDAEGEFAPDDSADDVAATLAVVSDMVKPLILRDMYMPRCYVAGGE